MTDSRNFENNLVRIIAAIMFLIVAFFAIRFGANVYSGKLTAVYAASSQTLNIQLKAEIESETDAYQAVKMGMKFGKSQNNDLAILALQKATVLDPNYRDAWVELGAAQLKTGDAQAAIISLKKAEDLDPIYPRTYELLKLAYEQTDNTDAAKKAEEKWQYLTKQQ